MSLTQWQWASQHVQSKIRNGQYLSAESALILAGPPRISQTGGTGGINNGIVSSNDTAGVEGFTTLFGVGLIMAFNIQQNAPISRQYEIGSRRGYFIRGRHINSFNLARLKFFGPSLLRALYAYYPADQLQQAGVEIEGASLPTPNASDPEAPYTYPIPDSDLPGYKGETTGTGRKVEGNTDFWINFQSSVMTLPLGLCVILRSSTDYNYGAFYMEDTMLESHSMGISADSILITENTSGQFDQVKPVKMQSL